MIHQTFDADLLATDLTNLKAHVMSRTRSCFYAKKQGKMINMISQAESKPNEMK